MSVPRKGGRGGGRVGGECPSFLEVKLRKEGGREACLNRNMGGKAGSDWNKSGRGKEWFLLS